MKHISKFGEYTLDELAKIAEDSNQPSEARGLAVRMAYTMGQRDQLRASIEARTAAKGQ